MAINCRLPPFYQTGALEPFQAIGQANRIRIANSPLKFGESQLLSSQNVDYSQGDIIAKQLQHPGFTLLLRRIPVFHPAAVYVTLQEKS